MSPAQSGPEKEALWRGSASPLATVLPPYQKEKENSTCLVKSVEVSQSPWGSQVAEQTHTHLFL